MHAEAVAQYSSERLGTGRTPAISLRREVARRSGVTYGVQ
jgi:hypothetical protein